MGLLGNLGRIITAPIEIIDKTIVEPVADVADALVEGLTGEDR